MQCVLWIVKSQHGNSIEFIFTRLLIVINYEPRLEELAVMIDQKHNQLHEAKSILKS
jgi:predicted component of type VI protein secretion system